MFLVLLSGHQSLPTQDSILGVEVLPLRLDYNSFRANTMSTLPLISQPLTLQHKCQMVTVPPPPNSLV